MAGEIEAIFFDVNGTLRSTSPAGEDQKREKIQQMLDLLGEPATADDFAALLEERIHAYRVWARRTRRDLTETELWTTRMLPDHGAGRIQALAPRLHQLWREATAVRSILPEAPEVIRELSRRGYRLGIVSNTLGERELDLALRGLNIRGLFETIVLSSQVGFRKPDARIMLQAANNLSIDPNRCAYVGNRPDRDVEPSRAAGFAQVVLVRASRTSTRLPGDPSPDRWVESLGGLLHVFGRAPTMARPIYDASVSTMWIRHNLPGVPDLFDLAPRLGFAAVELNHQIDSTMLNGIALEHHLVSSVHEPCPADIPMDRLKERDWLMSSPDEENRRRGVEAIKHSIELAGHLRVPIVVHCGMMSTDQRLEQRLKALLKEDRRTSEDYRSVQQEMVEARRGWAPQHMDAVIRSLDELLKYAGALGVQLGLENRYHYFDIPSLDEMGDLLRLAGPERLGFVYDVGHAQVLDRLGFFPHEEWLRRYSTRIIEAHLHDVQGTTDHLAPGVGEVDFRMVASYLPHTALRTLELQGTNTPDQVRAGLQYLAQCGCIRLL